MRDRDDGSVLALVPAAVLVLVMLGAIAVDSAVAFLGQRELSNAAAAAANDAATAALSDAGFYGSGALSLDRARADAVARHAVAARVARGVTIDDVSVDVAGARVCVTVRGRVAYLFARAIPFADHEARVTGRAGAVAVAGPAGAGAVPPPADCPA